jgi:hypothetical protein
MDNSQTTNCTNMYFDHDQLELYNVITRLWLEHVFWTRAFIKSQVNNLGDLEDVTKRLLRNPADFADVLVQFYGEENAETFEALFTEHLVIASEVIKAVINNDMDTFEEKETAWYTNADEIAAFFGEINPNWDEEMWKSMLYEHLDMTQNEFLLMLNNQYADSITQFDFVQDAALIMADYMACGIIQQFLMD